MAPVGKKPFRAPTDRPATWDDLLEVPEELIGEIIDGELVVSPRPDLPHTEVASHLGVLLGGPFYLGHGGPGGWVLLDAPRVRFGRDIRVPDLAGWRRERWVNLPRRGPIPLVPDWVCEVLSRSTERTDRTLKRALYQRAGVGHLWLVSPEARTLEVHRRTPAGWLLIGTHEGTERGARRALRGAGARPRAALRAGGARAGGSGYGGGPGAGEQVGKCWPGRAVCFRARRR